MDLQPIVMHLKKWGPVVLWMALIFVVSAQPTLPAVEDSFLDLVIKKGGHMAAYGILAWLIWRAVESVPGEGRLAILVWLAAVLYAGSDELHQLFVPGRHGSLADVMADGLGALIAVIVLWRLACRRRGF